MQIVPTLLDGGAEKFVCELSIELKNRGHDVLLLQVDSRQGDTLPKLISSANLPRICLFRKRFIDFKFFFQLFKLLRNTKPDVIHTHLGSLSLIFPVIFLSKPKCCIHTFHTLANKEAVSYSLAIKKIMLKVGFVPIAVSKTVAQSVERIYSQKPHVIKNGIKLENYLAKKKANQNDTFTFLMVGRLEKVKNNDLVIDAFAEFISNRKYRNAQLLIIGKGSEEKKLIDKVKEYKLGQNVKILGFRENVAEYYRKADVLINASDYEGCSLSLIEALVSGLRIISKNNESNRELLQDNAFYFNHEKELSKVLSEVFNSRNGKFKGIKVEDFSIEKVCGQYEKSYLSILKNGRL